MSREIQLLQQAIQVIFKVRLEYQWFSQIRFTNNPQGFAILLKGIVLGNYLINAPALINQQKFKSSISRHYHFVGEVLAAEPCSDQCRNLFKGLCQRRSSPAKGLRSRADRSEQQVRVLQDYSSRFCRQLIRKQLYQGVSSSHREKSIDQYLKSSSVQSIVKRLKPNQDKSIFIDSQRFKSIRKNNRHFSLYLLKIQFSKEELRRAALIKGKARLPNYLKTSFTRRKYIRKLLDRRKVLNGKMIDNELQKEVEQMIKIVNKRNEFRKACEQLQIDIKSLRGRDSFAKGQKGDVQYYFYFKQIAQSLKFVLTQACMLHYKPRYPARLDLSFNKKQKPSMRYINKKPQVFKAQQEREHKLIQQISKKQQQRLDRLSEQARIKNKQKRQKSETEKQRLRQIRERSMKFHNKIPRSYQINHNQIIRVRSSGSKKSHNSRSSCSSAKRAQQFDDSILLKLQRKFKKAREVRSNLISRRSRRQSDHQIHAEQVYSKASAIKQSRLNHLLQNLSLKQMKSQAIQRRKKKQALESLQKKLIQQNQQRNFHKHSRIKEAMTAQQRKIINKFKIHEQIVEKLSRKNQKSVQIHKYMSELRAKNNKILLQQHNKMRQRRHNLILQKHSFSKSRIQLLKIDKQRRLQQLLRVL